MQKENPAQRGAHDRVVEVRAASPDEVSDFTARLAGGGIV